MVERVPMQSMGSFAPVRQASLELHVKQVWRTMFDNVHILFTVATMAISVHNSKVVVAEITWHLAHFECFWLFYVMISYRALNVICGIIPLSHMWQRLFCGQNWQFFFAEFTRHCDKLARLRLVCVITLFSFQRHISDMSTIPHVTLCSCPLVLFGSRWTWAKLQASDTMMFDEFSSCE